MRRLARKAARLPSRTTALAGAPLLASLWLPTSAAASESPPAGGAPLADVALATFGGAALSTVLLAVGIAHRSGHTRVLDRAAAWSERNWGLPGWAALPGMISTGALLVALLGMYWDISLHIDQGRDSGPLANPAHYLILAGLFGVLVAGFVAIVLPRRDPGPSAVTIAGDWRAPVGGLMLFACAAFSLIGFPLDDGWHRLFGQDVTLWGPTHLMLFGGAAMTLIGRSVLLVEGARAARGHAGGHAVSGEQRVPAIMRVQRAGLAGAFLIGLSTFQGEFDFGVPQFNLLFQPLLIAVAAAVSLVCARLWAGRGGALIAVGLFVAVRGFVALAVGPVLGETTPHFPLYIAEAALVELAALRFAGRSPIAFGALAGGLIGTVGLAAEWAWSWTWMPLPWPDSLLAEAALLTPIAAVAGGVVGALIGVCLSSGRLALPRRTGRWLAGSSVAIALVIGYSLHTTDQAPVRAHVTLAEVQGAPENAVSARVRLDPPSATADARWLTVTSWQGDGFVLDRLERTGDGTYRTTKPIPVHGDWKTLLRLHRRGALEAVPIYLPADRAIPAAAVPARPSFTRSFVADKDLLQREARATSPAATAAAYLAVLTIALALLGLMAWGLWRLADGPGAGAPPPAGRERVAERTRALRPGTLARSQPSA